MREREITMTARELSRILKTYRFTYANEQLDPDRIKNLARRYLEKHNAKNTEETTLF